MTKPRLAKLSDHPELLSTVAEWHQRAFGYLDVTRTVTDRIERLQSHLGLDAIPTTFLIFVDDKPAGCASIVSADMSVRPNLTPWLASVFVLPEQRRQGLGAELVQHVVSAARATPHSTLYLYAIDREAYYARLGWRLREHLPYLGHQVAVMSIDVVRSVGVGE